MRSWQGAVLGALVGACDSRAAPVPDAAATATISEAAAAAPVREPTAPVVSAKALVAAEDLRRVRLATTVETDAADAAASPVDAGEAAKGHAKTVLHIGDSMVGGAGGLTKALEARFADDGARLVREYKVSESIVSFDKSPRLAELVSRHQPDIVVLTLGTNDALVPHPDVYAANVRSIVRRIASRECYWMGPPLWKPDTGIVAVLRDNVAPCHFFDSSKLALERRSDGVHPTDKGGADWAAAFWAWRTSMRQRPPGTMGPALTDPRE